MNRNRIWIFIGVAGIILFFAFFIMLLWNLGYFDFTGSEASAKIVASAIALVGGLIGSLVTIIGIFLKNSLDQRNANVKENAERRLKLEAAIQAMQLLSTDAGKDVSVSQRSGVLFTLMHLGLSDLAITMMGQMLPSNKIDANTAAWLINHVFESNLEDLSIEASGLLNEYHDKFLIDNGHYEFPRCLNLTCNTKLPKPARRNSALALLRIVIKRRRAEWSDDSLNAIFATLIFMWKDETAEEISDGVGTCLKAMITIRAGRILYLESGVIDVDEVIAELEKQDFNLTREFKKISKSVEEWCE